LIKKFGTLPIMGVGVALNFACIALALSGLELQQFLVALFLLGVGWNFLFTGSTTLAMQAWTPVEKDRGQAAINFFVFATMALTSFASGALVTTQGWTWLNVGSLVPVALTAGALMWMAVKQKSVSATSP
jgi:MFS family permease